MSLRVGALPSPRGLANACHERSAASSLGAVISVSEITRRGMELAATNFRPLETFTFIAVVYFFICWPLAMAIRWWERRLQNR